LESLDEEIRSLTGANETTMADESDWNKVEVINP
jgi:hypothetical protein